MSTPGGPSHYDVLGVAKDASPEEIKRQYKRLSKIVHSDAGGDDALFRLIQGAYEILSDADARRAYDRDLERPGGAVPPGGGQEARPPGHEGFGPAPTTAPPTPAWERAAAERAAAERAAAERQAWERQVQDRRAWERQSWERAARERGDWAGQFREPGTREGDTGVRRAGAGGRADGGATTALLVSASGFLCGITFPVGLVMGLRARGRIANSNGLLTGSGRALAAAALGGLGTAGWVVVFAVERLIESM